MAAAIAQSFANNLNLWLIWKPIVLAINWAVTIYRDKSVILLILLQIMGVIDGTGKENDRH